MRSVTNGEIEAYFPVITKLAGVVERSGAGKQASAEFDDLFQEGCIFVWQTLQKGIEPQAELIHRRMLNWVRFLSRHNNLSYEEIVDQDCLVPV